MKILVIGATGMLGNTLYRFFSSVPGIDAFGSLRDARSKSMFDAAIRDNLIAGVDVGDINSLIGLFGRIKPDLVINCIGIIKQLGNANDPLQAIPINSLLPHTLARLTEATGSRLVHLSTDCVFRGDRGAYHESDAADALDLYGRSKLMGEVDYAHAITLRTSIIGHELNSANGLIGWFLSQEQSVKGYAEAIFSGFPTIEIGHIILDHVIPAPELRGLYHVASEPISKLELLRLVSETYGKSINIVRDDSVRIDRSLDATRFNAATGYQPPAWPVLIKKMKDFG